MSGVWDLVVIGGGAAGLMAATSAGRLGKTVLVIEKNRKLGVKILMSGGTRCNITQACDRRGIVDAFREQGRFLQSALSRLGPEEVVAEIESQGVPTKTEPTGKIFPVSDRAIDVRDALVRMAQSANAKLMSGVAVKDITKTESGFQVMTEKQNFDCASVLITTGGRSYPGCGTTGDGYHWAKKFGHTLVSPVPALTPILSNSEWVKDLKGLTLPDVGVGVEYVPSEGSTRGCLTQCRGSFLFTHFGFSGPAPLNVSRAITTHEDRASLRLSVDWLPGMEPHTFRETVQGWLRENGKQTLNNILSKHLSRRLVEKLLLANKMELDRRGAETGKRELNQLVKILRNFPFQVPGTLGFEKAEVTAGGVVLNEVSSKTLESKRMKGLYFAGEVLDLDGPIGGFNFQAAFSTGYVAGQGLGG